MEKRCGTIHLNNVKKWLFPKFISNDVSDAFANFVRSYVQHQINNSLRASFVHVCIPISINRLSMREILSEAVQKLISVLKHKCDGIP